MTFLENLAGQMPLSVFAFVGSIVDEVFAILPSPFIPLTAGSLAVKQGEAFVILFWLAFTGTVGKTLATVITYYLADKFEDVFTKSKLGKILGLSKDELERYGKYFDGTKKDEVVMIILRALPFIPTLPVSVLAGVIKLNLKSFLITTFIGTYIRFMFYLILAYEGVKKYEGLLDTLDTTNKIFEVVIVLAVLGWGFMFLRNNWEKIFRRLKRMVKSAS